MRLRKKKYVETQPCINGHLACRLPFRTKKTIELNETKCKMQFENNTIAT